MKHQLFLAPLQGYTESYFRNAFYQSFKDFEGALSPFIPSGLGEKVKHSRIHDLWKEHNKGMPVVPQVLGNKAQAIVPLAKYLYDYGYKELNINMGCPMPNVSRKRRGSGLLAAPDIMARLLEALCEQTPNKISIKLRLGYHHVWDIKQILPIINQFPIYQLTIHPRIGTQIYKGVPNIEAYKWCLANTAIPVIYSGDIFTVQDFEQLQQQLPTQTQWMIGRGVLFDIFLPHSLHGYQLSIEDKRHMFATFHSHLEAELKEHKFSEHRMLSKLKEYWGYFAHHFQQHEDIHYQLTHCNSLVQFMDSKQAVIAQAAWKTPII